MKCGIIMQYEGIFKSYFRKVSRTEQDTAKSILRYKIRYCEKSVLWYNIRYYLVSWI